MPRDANADADPRCRRCGNNARGTEIRIDKTRLRQAAYIDERTPRQADIRRDRQWIVQLGGLRINQPAAERVAGHDVVRPGATDLEPAEIVTAQKEPVDDLLLDALIPEVTEATGHRDAPVTVPGKAVQRNEILGIDVGADELCIAAKPCNVIAQRDKIAGMRVHLAVPVVEGQR